jgi:predicted O-linked N-acetylglucosamine transferase (SPINDLY family)
MNRTERRRQQKGDKKAFKDMKPIKSASSLPGEQTLTIDRQVLIIDQAINLAVQHHTAGRLSEAENIYQQILEADPHQPMALHLLGVIAHQMKKNGLAFDLITRALAIKPNYEEAQNNLGSVLIHLGKMDDAVASYQKVIAINPTNAGAHNNLGLTLQRLGRFSEAATSLHESAAIKPGDAKTLSNIANLEQYRPNVTLEKLEFIHARWEKQIGAPLQKVWRGHANIIDPERRLRIGFVSPDLYSHPVGYFIIGLMKNRMEIAVEFVSYSDSKPDNLTELIMELSNEWTDTRGMSDEDLTEHIRLDRIDILIDLAGHTANNRLLVFARKPAPIQVTWAGYVGSTGLSAMDYLIADYRHAPEGVESYYAERIIRLPFGYICYESPAYAPDVESLPFERNGFITFCGFHNPTKVNDDIIMAWAKILNAVPNSKLVLKYHRMNANGIHNRISDQFRLRGIESSRLILEGKSQHVELLARYNDIDIALDTFPYSGGLTTCEAVWMGVPVITVPGETFASRHSLSHLTNIGVPELVADDVADYVAKAVELANDIPRLSVYRSGLRDQMANSPLCDGVKFARDFTSAMRDIWREWCYSQNR